MGYDPESFVGREAELEVLARAAAGRRQLVVVSGVAGIGKTRLCEQAAQRATSAGFRVVWGSCWPYGGAPPLWPWPAVLTELVGADGVRVLAQDPGVARNLGDPVDSERFARFCAIADLLTQRLGGQPTMVVIDDLHAADEGALLLTRFLVRSPVRVPLSLVVTRHDEDPARGRDRTGGGRTAGAAPSSCRDAGTGVDRLLDDLERDATVVRLRGFDLYDTTAFLKTHGFDADAFRGAGTGDGGKLAGAVLRVTGGSPLLLGRMVAHGQPSSVLDGMKQVIGDAVARLDPASDRVVALLAVLGETGSVGDVANLAGLPVAATLDALAEAHAAGLVEPVGGSRYTFGHGLIREAVAAAATLTSAQRLDAHARAAALRSAHDGPDRLAWRAQHALAAAARSDADAAVAVDACRDAARAMRRGLDYPGASVLLDAAVAVSETRQVGTDRATLLVERAEAVLACGRIAEARTAFTEAAAAADERREPTLLARAALGLGGIWLNEHRDPLVRRRVLGMQRAALDGLPEREASLRSRLAIRLATEAVYDGGPLAAVHAALARVRQVGDGQALSEALSLAHHAMLGPEHASARLRLAEDLITVGTTAGEGLLALVGLLWRTVDLYHLGDPRAHQALATLRERAEILDCPSVLYIVAAMDVMRLVRTGRLDEAEAAAEACFELGVRVGDADAPLYYSAQLGSIRWMQGRDEEMLDLVTAVVAAPTRPTGEFSGPAAVAAMTARVGRIDEARAALDRLTGLGLGDLPTSSTWLAGMFAVAETAGLVGDVAVAEQVYQLLVPFADLPVMPSLAITCFGSVERALGIAALAVGDVAGAVRHHERAVEANRRFGNLPAVAISRAELAEVLAAGASENDLARAQALWAAAHADAVAMGLTARAQRWAARMREAVPRPPAAQTGILSREDDGWTISADGRRAILPDLQGVRYLAVLFERSGNGVTALELCGAAVVDSGHHEIADRHALAAYRRRIRDLDADLADADANADLERAHRLRLEREAVREHLTRVVGLGGRSRAFTVPSERARTAVRKAVKRAVDTITAADADLGAELRATITTGSSCRHLPDATHPRRWTVRR